MAGSLTYKSAGVDIARAEKSLKALSSKISSTYTRQVLSGIGLFGGFFELEREGYKVLVLVSSTDGVGTKLKVAILADRHDTIGMDLVNHCINDIAVCGAKPLFFLDYFASGNLQPNVYEQVVGGMARACRDAGIPLIGGETAEMPDFYQPGDYDISGTIVGIVEKSKIINGQNIAAGDVLIGISSNGLHTNGYSLARKALLDRFSLHRKIAELNKSLAQELLKVHLNYYPLISKVCQNAVVHGMVHVTGGGIVKNSARVVPRGLKMKIAWGSWPEPPIFELIRKSGNIPEEDMRLTFNLGIGVIFIVPPADAPTIITFAKEQNLTAFEIGQIIAGK